MVLLELDLLASLAIHSSIRSCEKKEAIITYMELTHFKRFQNDQQQILPGSNNLLKVKHDIIFGFANCFPL